MSKNRILSQLITARLHELEEIIDGKRIHLSHYTCGVCVPAAYSCAQCPLNTCDDELANVRRWFLYCSTHCEFLGDKPNRQLIAKDHYKFILKLLKKNGWEYV